MKCTSCFFVSFAVFQRMEESIVVALKIIFIFPARKQRLRQNSQLNPNKWSTNLFRSRYCFKIITHRVFWRILRNIHYDQSSRNMQHSVLFGPLTYLCAYLSFLFFFTTFITILTKYYSWSASFYVKNY